MIVLNHLTDSTRLKIKQLIPKNIRVYQNDERFDVLMKIYNGHTLEDFKYIDFLFSRNLITRAEKITVFGRISLLSHLFKVDFVSVLILTKIWLWQRKNPDKYFEPQMTITDKLFMYNKRSLINLISKMRTKNTLSYSGRQTLVRIEPTIFSNLDSYMEDLLLIDEFIENISDKIENLIQADPNTIQNLKEKKNTWLKQIS